MAMMTDIHYQTAWPSKIELELQKGDVGALADELCQKRIISDGEKSVVQDTDKRAIRARRLFNVMRHHYPSCHDECISVLKDQQFTSKYDDLANMLEDILFEIQNLKDETELIESKTEPLPIGRDRLQQSDSYFGDTLFSSIIWENESLPDGELSVPESSTSVQVWRDQALKPLQVSSDSDEDDLLTEGNVIKDYGFRRPRRSRFHSRSSLRHPSDDDFRRAVQEDRMHPEDILCPCEMCLHRHHLATRVDPYQHRERLLGDTDRYGYDSTHSCFQSYDPHLTKEYLRQYKCPYCQEIGEYQEITSSHLETCPKVKRCSNRDCQWLGTQEELEEHLQTCEYALLPCPNQCIPVKKKDKVSRKSLQNHLTNECPKRPYKCPYCKEMGEYQERITSHLEICTKFKVLCPNSKCRVSIPRCEVPTHRFTCDYETVSCKHPACKERLLRKDLKKHEEDDSINGHYKQNTQASSEYGTKTASTVSGQKSVFRTTPFRFKLGNFKARKDEDDKFCDLPFYDSHYGYKMGLEVYANGNGDGEGTHVSVYAHLMKGDNDDSLTWPFTGTVTFELLNQLEDKNHHKQTSTFTAKSEVSKRVVDGERGTGWGKQKFISHAEFDYQPDKNCQYLKDDTLIFRVSVQILNQEPSFDKYNHFLAGPIKVRQTLQFSTYLPFVKPVQVLKISSEGKQYRDNSLGLCIDIPEGAVSEGSLLQLEIGMCLYGPFKFPGGLNPIAPILMLNPQNNIKLSKNITITLPHNISDAKEDDIESLSIDVIKADHTSLLDADECVFDNIIGDSNLSFHTSDNYELATFSLPHFCFVTLRADTSLKEEVEKRKEYCICPLTPSPEAVASGNYRYPLCVTYCMPPCLQAINDQFSREGYTLWKMSIKRFVFKGEKHDIKAKLEKLDCKHGWEISLSSADKDGFEVIDAASVDFWAKKEDDLRFEIENFMYPPSFQVLVLRRQATASRVFVRVQFKLSTQESDDFFMSLPLDNHKSIAASPSDEQDSPEYQTIIACTPQLTAALSLDPVTVSGHLLSKSLIPPNFHDQLVRSTEAPSDKAQRLVVAVTTCVKTNASTFNTLISVLKAQGGWSESILSILMDTFFTKRGQ